MRCFIALAGVLGGCFAPSAPSGAPCDPVANNCPGDQVCRAESGGFFCGNPIVIDAALGGPDASDPDAPHLDAPAPDGAMVTHVEYPATVAECLDPMAPNPLVCRAINGQQQMVIDMKDSATLNPWQGYVRFDLDTAIAGKTIVKVQLRVVATNDAKAPGGNTGEVWKVQSFTLQSLTGTTPAKIGASPLAGTQGAVIKLGPIAWPLPLDTVASGGAVFLAVITTASDGVNYWNIDGANPPRLAIDFQ